MLIEAAEALEAQDQARRQALEEAAAISWKVFEDQTRKSEQETSGVWAGIHSERANGAAIACKSIRALIDQPAPDVVMEPRDPTQERIEAAK